MLADLSVGEWVQWASGLWHVWLVGSAVITGAVTWLSATYRKLAVVSRMGAEMQAAVTRIETLVSAELKYNGGKSIKDVLDTLVASHNRTEAWSTALLNHSNSPMWRAAPDGGLEWVNAAFTRATGFGIEHLKGLAWLDLACDEERDEVHGTWQKSVACSMSYTAEFALAPGGVGATRVVMAGHPFFSAQKQGEALVGFTGTLTVQG